MATRARIGIKQKSGRIIASYQHWDGYLGDRHGSDFEHMNCYYGRDRGEKDVGYKIYKDEAEYIKNGFRSGEQFVYLLKDTGEKNYLGKPKFTWHYVASHYTDEGKEVIDPFFRPLEEEAIKDHIDILNRVLDMRKDRKVA